MNFNSDDELEDVIKSLKGDLKSLDATIENLVQEAQNKTGTFGNNKYHELATPLVKLYGAKQKSINQMLKIIDMHSKPEYDEEEVDLDSLYSNFEVDVDEEETEKVEK